MENLTRFLDLFARYCELDNGKGFTICIKFDELPLENPDAEVTAAERAGYDEIGRRLEPITRLYQLLTSLRERKQIFKHETRRVAFDTKIPWTDNQLALLGRIESELKTLNTFIKP